jgi:small subunit ribosomal protein S18
MARPNTSNKKKDFYKKNKKCYFIENKITYIDYKNIELLNKFIASNGKILPKRSTGTTAKNQRRLSVAIKRAREMALLPYHNKFIAK